MKRETVRDQIEKLIDKEFKYKKKLVKAGSVMSLYYKAKINSVQKEIKALETELKTSFRATH